MTVSMWLATIFWLSLVVGYCLRKNTTIHVPLMVFGILGDIALVLYLQFTRSAIQTALSFELAALKQLHIAFSSLALLLYFPMLYLGFRLVRGNFSAELKQFHVKLGKITLTLRTLGFILMFSMLQ